LRRSLRISVLLNKRQVDPDDEDRQAEGLSIGQRINGDAFIKKLIAAAMLIATSTGVGLAQDIEKGATVFKQCSMAIAARLAVSYGPVRRRKRRPGFGQSPRGPRRPRLIAAIPQSAKMRWLILRRRGSANDLFFLFRAISGVGALLYNGCAVV